VALPSLQATPAQLGFLLHDCSPGVVKHALQAIDVPPTHVHAAVPSALALHLPSKSVVG
jgi:hypothetical protein